MDDGRVLVDVHVTSVAQLLAAEELVDCLIEGLDAEAVALDGMRFDGCHVRDCHLRGASVVGTRFVGVSFLRCHLGGIVWSTADLGSLGVPVAFAGCDLTYSTFAGLALPGLVAHACRMVDVDLGGTDLTGADLRHSELRDAALDGATLVDVDLTGATGYHFDPRETRSRGCRVSLPDAVALLQTLGFELTTAGEPPAALEAVLGRATR